MEKNVGSLDRVIRISLSIVIVAVLYINDVLFVDTVATVILLSIAVINVFVALFRVCPLYSLANINTAKKNKNKE